MAALINDPVEYCLHKCGFLANADRLAIKADGFSDFDDFEFLTTGDISDMASRFGKRRVADGRINFGLARTKKLQGLLLWVHDHFRADDQPDHLDFTADAANEALQRELSRKEMREMKGTVSKPDPLKGEADFHKFLPKLENYLSSLIGVNGVPLVYVIRAVENPDPNEQYNTYQERCIARAPLQGTRFEDDARTVHQVIADLTQGHPPEEWISPLKKYKDGRRDIMKLKEHYVGGANTTRRITEADALEKSLHYKSERSLPWEKFLNKFQEMIGIYRANYEPKDDSAQRRIMLTMCKDATDSAFQSALSHCRYQSRKNAITITEMINDLSTTVAENKDLKRSIAETNTGRDNNRSRGEGRGDGGRGGRSRGGGRGRGGRGRGGRSHNTRTGYRKQEDWDKLSFAERDAIRKERENKPSGGNRDKSATVYNKRSIKEIEARISALEKVGSSEDEAEKSNPSSGTAFGGKSEAKKKRRVGFQDE